MPEAGRTPTPQYKQGGINLPWGEAAQLNDAVGLVPPPDEPQYAPSGDAEQFLFSPTDRPGEPVTAGQPYGPGALVVPGARETDDQIVQRVAAQALKDPSAPKQLKDFANRALNGM